jgi:hypothetical protein
MAPSRKGLAGFRRLFRPGSSAGAGISDVVTDTAGSSVLIERSEEAYIVLIRTPDASQRAVDEVKASSSGERVFEVVRWEVLTATIDEIVSSFVRKNEYPERHVARGMTDLLARYAGTPFGLTWTGGVALTFNDYEHTKQIYQQWKADPAGYEHSRPSRDPRGDPIAPQHHFRGLLGEAY